jgi:hypothetical protein
VKMSGLGPIPTGQPVGDEPGPVPETDDWPDTLEVLGCHPDGPLPEPGREPVFLEHDGCFADHQQHK